MIVLTQERSRSIEVDGRGLAIKNAAEGLRDVCLKECRLGTYSEAAAKRVMIGIVKSLSVDSKALVLPETDDESVWWLRQIEGNVTSKEMQARCTKGAESVFSIE